MRRGSEGEDVDDVDNDLPPLTGSVNTSGTYRCPPGTKDLDAALLNITGREPGSAMDKRHRVRPVEEILSSMSSYIRSLTVENG